jgi:hypothetical protein
MVTLFCFLHHGVIALELFLSLEGETIDASELFILSISSPVCTGEFIDRVASLWDFSCRENMRTLTHVDEGRPSKIEP